MHSLYFFVTFRKLQFVSLVEGHILQVQLVCLSKTVVSLSFKREAAEQKQEKKKEKDEKEEKKRLEAEKKEQREREKKEQDARKKFKVSATGQEAPAKLSRMLRSFMSEHAVRAGTC